MITAGKANVIALNGFDSAETDMINRVVFEDGTVWDGVALSAMASTINGHEFDDVMRGTSHADQLRGLSGNDVIASGAGDDVLNGGAGDDVLIGGAGNDTYLFNRGYGNDAIIESDATAGNVDTIRLGSGISATDISLSVDSSDLKIIINDTGEQFVVQGYVRNAAARIEQIKLSDGTVWDSATILTAVGLVIPDVTVDGAAGDDLLHGTNGVDQIHGFDGNDTLLAGDGRDTLDGGAGADVLVGGAGGDAVDGHELGLHISWKGRIFAGPEAHRERSARSLDADPVSTRFDVDTGSAQLVDHRIEVLRLRALQQHIAASGSNRAEESAGLDAVWNDAVRQLRRMQTADALDANTAAAMAFDLRAHRDQHLGQIANLGLLRSVFKQGLAIGQRRGHQEIFGPGDGDHVGGDACTLELGGLGDDVAMLDADLRAHRLQPLDMLIHRARADRATARQRHGGPTETRQQGPERQDRCAHRLHQLIGRFRLGHQATVDRHLVAAGFAALGSRAHIAQQLQHRRDIMQARHIVQSNRLGRQQRCAEFGQGRVLGA